MAREITSRGAGEATGGRQRREQQVSAEESAERRQLEAAMLEVSDREQRRFGQELHDGLCQQLFTAAVACDRLREKLVARSQPEAVEAAQVLARLDMAITDARRLARRLSLPQLTGHMVAAALRDLASATSRDFRVACEVECGETAGIQDETVATHLYRIAREAVYNAARHAKPTHIRIVLALGKRVGRLKVLDDGVGIGESPASSGGMGLEMMKWRAGLVGGSLSIRRNPQGGTSVACDFPLVSSRQRSAVRKPSLPISCYRIP